MNSQKFSCPFINGYSEHTLNKLRTGTLKTYIPFIHKFWLYALHFPVKKDQSFKDYIWKYRTTIATRGFEIIKKDTVMNLNIEYESIKFKPTNSVKADMIALKSYFLYIYDELNNENYDLIDKIPFGAYGGALNYDKLTHSDMHSKGSSYGLKAKGMMRDALASNLTIFDELIQSKNHIGKKNHSSSLSMKCFPLSIFDNFIMSVKNPRDRLLYLLCGCLGAREGQALNLTYYDVDTNNQKIYLTDPTTNEIPTDINGKIFEEQLGRKDLLAKYNISASVSPHSLIRFKYAIPAEAETNRELMFLPGPYEEEFFRTLSDVMKTIDIRRNPFIFQTNSGGRLLPSNASETFERNFEKFKFNNPRYENYEIKGKLHSFRHMYGVIWADIAHHLDETIRADKIKKGERVPNTIEMVKFLVARKMGITSDAINIYFNRSEYSRNLMQVLMEKFGDNMMNVYKFAKDYHDNKIILENDNG